MSLEEDDDNGEDDDEMEGDKANKNTPAIVPPLPLKETPDLSPSPSNENITGSGKHLPGISSAR